MNRNFARLLYSNYGPLVSEVTTLPNSVTRWWNKKLPIFLNIAQKVAKSFFTLQLYYLKSPKIYQNIWATFVRNFLTKQIKNRPIWSHCCQLSHNHSSEITSEFVNSFYPVICSRIYTWLDVQWHWETNKMDKINTTGAE